MEKSVPLFVLRSPVLPAAQQLGGINVFFGKLLKAHLSDSDSGCVPVANERFSHSFPYTSKCQRKCPSDSNYRCCSGEMAALLLNTWNWQQAGRRRHWAPIAALATSSSRSVCEPQPNGTSPVPLPHSALILSLKPACSLRKQKWGLFQSQSIHPVKLSHGWIWRGIFADITGHSQEDKVYLHPTAGDVLQSLCYLFYFFNILTVKLLEPGLPKIFLFLPTYHLLSTCLRKAFLAWQREPFIPLLCLWSWALQHDWDVARKEKTKYGAASWLHVHCAKVVLEEKLPSHRRSSGRTVLLVLFTLLDATRKLHSRLRPRCAIYKLRLAASSCTDGFHASNKSTPQAAFRAPHCKVRSTVSVLVSLAASHSNSRLLVSS